MKSLVACLAATSLVIAGPTMAQIEASLDVDELVGVWNMVYEDGQRGEFTISTNERSALEVFVKVANGSEGQAQDILIENDTVSFARHLSNLPGGGLIVKYTATAHLEQGAGAA